MADEHRGTLPNEIVCPWCGERVEHQEDDELAYNERVDCPNCDRVFYLTAVRTDTYYVTRRTVRKEKGDG
jgi:uncharacterized Zn finger protein (UPF0148 family)